MVVPWASMPLREARVRVVAPCPDSQRAVKSPSPPVPPLSIWPKAPLTGRSCGVCTRTTTLPTFLPLCSSRNAASSCRRSSNVCIGSPCSTPHAARLASLRSTVCIHAGFCFVAESIAIMSYVTVPPTDACIRCFAHTLRLPISSNRPASPSSATEADGKSDDRLFSTR